MYVYGYEGGCFIIECHAWGHRYCLTWSQMTEEEGSCLQHLPEYCHCSFFPILKERDMQKTHWCVLNLKSYTYYKDVLYCDVSDGYCNTRTLILSFFFWYFPFTVTSKKTTLKKLNYSFSLLLSLDFPERQPFGEVFQTGVFVSGFTKMQYKLMLFSQTEQDIQVGVRCHWAAKHSNLCSNFQSCNVLFS